MTGKINNTIHENATTVRSEEGNRETAIAKRNRDQEESVYWMHGTRIQIDYIYAHIIYLFKWIYICLVK
jgi:hypothetical protein